ncbi:hypothetical protein ACLB2K_000195 [Fragaria x ananassa]
MGGFGNVRDVYDWAGLKLEVDETKYEFWTCYEIKCESEDPEGKWGEIKIDNLRFNDDSTSESATFSLFKCLIFSISED